MGALGKSLLVLPVAFIALVSISGSPGYQSATSVDLNDTIDKIGADLEYRYEWISGTELSACEREWKADVPYGVRDIYRLGDGNILVVSRSNLSEPGCTVKGNTDDDEEMLSIYSPEGSLLSRRSIGSRWVETMHASRDGGLVTIVTGGYDDMPENIVMDQNGTDYFTASGKMVLYPSSDGEYLICSAPQTPQDRRYGHITDASGKTRGTEFGRFMNKDGSSRDDSVSSSFDESEWSVHEFLDGKMLLTKSSAPGDKEHFHDLALYDIEESAIVWRSRQHVLSSLVAVSKQDGEERFVLLSYRANEEGVRNTVISIKDGETVGRSVGGWISEGIGSTDGCFYVKAAGRLKMGLRFRFFLLKLSPSLHVEQYGLLCAGAPLGQMKSSDGYVWGIHRGCTLDNVCYPIVTAIYNMGIGSSSETSEEINSKRVDPILLEGFWVIDELTADKAVLIGQLDPCGGVLEKISIDRARIDVKRR